MSEYAQRFAENDIEIDVLSELTDQDLERLGVSLGHRRRMLRAILPGLPRRRRSPPCLSPSLGYRRAPPDHGGADRRRSWTSILARAD